MVDIFWLVVGGGGYILDGGGRWWMMVGRGGSWHSLVKPLEIATLVKWCF